MMLRTPPPQRKRGAESAFGGGESPVSDRRVVLYNDPEPVSSLDPSDQLVCTYQCRQMVKSEVMVALSSAEKQVQDYQSRVDILDNELRRSEEERKKFKDQLCLAEQELAASKGREQALQERILKEVDFYQKQIQIQIKHCSEIEVQLKKEMELRKNAEFSTLAAKDSTTSLEEKLMHLSESTEREKKRLLKELTNSKDDAKLSYSRLNTELERSKVRADCAIQESELLKKQMEKVSEDLNECLTEKSQLEHKLSNFTATSHNVASHDEQCLVKHLQEELRNFEAEVQEARKLKSSHVNVELLKEKLMEEKAYREHAETELSKLQAVDLNAIKMEAELAALKSVIQEIPGISSYEELPAKFSILQREALDSMKKVGDISECLRKLEVALESANFGKQQAEAEVALATQRAEECMLEVKQLKQMLKSITDERDRLRDIASINNQKAYSVEIGVADESLAKKLESYLAERENTIRELESCLQEQTKIITHQHDELKSAKEKLTIEAKRIKSLEREEDRLRSEIALLESKLGHGDYSAANTKVLRMVNTLAVDNEAKHTIDALRAELHKAQAKLLAVEELKGQSDAAKLIDGNITEKLAQLKGQIAKLEKREERYKTVFADKISVFRRACCSLFGYKIIMDDQQRPNGIPVTRFTLQSIYAQTDDEKLEFEYESGNTNILVNDYTSQSEISRQVDIFVQKMNSIPAFTANLTIESFNKRTLT